GDYDERGTSMADAVRDASAALVAAKGGGNVWNEVWGELSKNAVDGRVSQADVDAYLRSRDVDPAIRGTAAHLNALGSIYGEEAKARTTTTGGGEPAAPPGYQPIGTDAATNRTIRLT